VPEAKRNDTTAYRRKLRPPGDAVRAVASGDRVFYAANAATPGALVTALAARRGELADVHLVHLLLVSDNPLCAPEMAGHFRDVSLFVGHPDRRAVNEGRADAVPVFLKDIPKLFRDGHLPLDVAMISASPPDAGGHLHYGVECLATAAACAAARHVIVQVNRHMPRVRGSGVIHIDDVDAIVEHDAPLAEVAPHPATDVERAIGRHVRGLVHDGCTLQMGIGAIPDEVWEALSDLSDLGIHSEMMSDGAMAAVRRGNVTGARKTLHRGRAIISFALGSAALYAFLDDNEGVEAHPVDYVNDPWVIGQNDDLVSINSAIEVDLTGQVCADSIGTRLYSGFGGQLDFVRGAARSKGGKAIIALPSTAQDGARSRIVATLAPGAGVVTTRADVQYVVTEFGVAPLFGRTLRQRAEALIAIAHPDFREELAGAARGRRLAGMGS